MSRQPHAAEPAYEFAADEQPVFAGSPAAPRHSRGRMLAYGLVALLTGAGATLGNALVNVNISSLSGSLGLYLAQASWLPALYVAMNAGANLTLVKARTQFGIPFVTSGLLILYALAASIQLLLPCFASAAVTRAASGMAAAGLTTMTIYNLMQIFRGRLRPLALVIGIGLIQLGTPLARLVPVELLTLDQGRGLALLEMALALGLLAATLAVPLPPSRREPAFQGLDLVTIALMMPGLILLCGVLGLGRLLWWTDTPWLGWALAATIPLFTAAWMIEHHRARPLLQLGWLGSLDVLRFATVALMVRLTLAEQTYGAIGLLTAGGLTNDQLHPLFLVILLSMLGGIVLAALTLSEQRLPWQVMGALAMIAAGAWLDMGANSLTRPPQLYLSQGLVAAGTTLFAGPALIYGFLRMFRHGATHLVSFMVLFSITQNVGGLAGSALLGSYQITASRDHAQALAEHLAVADPQVASRLQTGAASLAPVLADPAARAAQGAGLLGRSLGREAGTLAFTDVFLAIGALALLTALYILYVILFNRVRRRRPTPPEVPA